MLSSSPGLLREGDTYETRFTTEADACDAARADSDIWQTGRAQGVDASGTRSH